MNCIVCSNSTNFQRFSPSISKVDNSLCMRCGLVFIPRESLLVKKYYKEDGYFKKSPNYSYKKQLISKSLLISESEKRVVSALEILPLQLKNKRVLDIGCGYGEILYVFREKYGCRVEGIEASSEAANFGKTMFSLDIHPGLLEEYSPVKKFDVIWCSHVLEHTSNPKIFLKKIRSLLKKDGHFYIEVPNIMKPSGGFSLDMFLYEEHLQTFSAYNLYMLLKESGFTIEAYSDSGFLKFWCNTSNAAKSIRPPIISSEEILKFLSNYKREYGVIDALKVYKQKALYVGKILLHKTRDIF